MSWKNLTVVAFLGLGFAAACGDDGPIEDIDRATDCSQVCDRYKDCIDGDYDTDKCTDRCEDMDSNERTAKIDDCENCLDDKSCGGSFECTVECAGIVP